jgi:putative endopeptidase
MNGVSHSINASAKRYKTYLRWHLLDDMASALSSPFEQASFDFHGRTLSGTTEQLPRWRRCTTAVDSNLGEALGEVYVKRALRPKPKRVCKRSLRI